MPKKDSRDIYGSENIEDWVERDGVWELREDVRHKMHAALEQERVVPLTPEQQEKERQLRIRLQEYMDVRKSLQVAAEKGDWHTPEFAVALKEKDFPSAKSAVQLALQKSKFGTACRTAQALGDEQLMKETILACRIGETDNYHDPSDVLNLAVTANDMATAKQLVAQSLKRGTLKEYLIDPVCMIGKQDPAYAKDFLQEHFPDTNGSVRVEVAKVAVALAEVDPQFAREIMQKDLAYRYGGPAAAEIAVALGDREVAKQAAKRCIESFHPDDAARAAIAVNDPDLIHLVKENAKGFGGKTVVSVGTILGDVEMLKKGVEGCLRSRAEKLAKGEFSANSTDSGENYERAAGEGMVAVAARDPEYGKALIASYFRDVVTLPRRFDTQIFPFAGGAVLSAVEKISLDLAERDPEAAREAAQKFHAISRHEIANRITARLFQKNFPKLGLSLEDGIAIMKTGSDQAAFAAGWALPPEVATVALDSIKDPNVIRNIKLGSIFNKQPEEYQRELADIAFSMPSDRQFERTLSRSLAHFDYDQVSSILLQKVNDCSSEQLAIRYLKTLVEIENPKGRTLATDLFANQKVQPHLRRYLAAKLIAEKHWDEELATILKKAETEGKTAEADAILVAMIKDLGLTPDKPAYEALEKPGILTGATLPERVNELKSLREEFARLSLSGLKERLKDDKVRQVFYLVKGGEYRYTLINNYSYGKFSMVVDKMLAQKVDETKMQEFDAAMAAGGVAESDRARIQADMREGRFPLPDQEKRSFAFDAAIDLGSDYEMGMARLQEVWGRELQMLAAVAESKEVLPLGIEDALTRFEGKDVSNPKTQRILEFLKHGQKQDYQSIKKVAEACKKELLTSLKQKLKAVEDKESVRQRMQEVERLNISGLLHAYLSERLPQLKDSAILQEWESHVRETLAAVESGPVKGGTKNKRFELTFLDKGRDFIRATRFADGRQCCFNSSNYIMDGQLSAADWIARLHADPLSFVMDIKEEGSRIVSGFVFGRMGIDPTTKRPVVMLNGIYSQESGSTMNNNILKLVEDKFARTIGASSVIIASKHGGTLAKMPDGYQSVTKGITAIRALQNNETVYDDIGTVPNGPFTFSGYERHLV